MRGFKKILYLAGVEAADQEVWPRVVQLAAASGASVTLHDVARPLSMYDAWLEMPIATRDLQDMIQQQRHAHLHDLGELAQAAHVTTHVQESHGKPFVDVIQAVLRDGYDLVAKGADNTSATTRLFSAGTDLNLQRKCPCPVWLLKPEEESDRRRIVAAVDLQPEDEDHRQINQLIVESAIAIAQADQRELEVVNTWELAGEMAMRTLAGVPEATIEKYARDIEQLHKSWMDEFLAPHQAVYDRCRGRVLRGPVEEVLPDLLDNEPASLLVMGTQARLGIPGFFIGNSAERILEEVRCSVMTIKPAGFVSPIRPGTH